LIKGAGSVVHLLTMAGMWLLLPIGPVAATLISGDRSYVSRYRQGLRASIAHLRGMGRGRPVARAVERWLGGVGDEPGAITGNCTHCGKCCLDKGCIFLRFDAQENSRCQIYQTRFWSMLPCGEYPLNGEEIAQYACPSFTAGVRRVIPIRSAPADVNPAGEEVPQTM
jgi:hypothetical protein